MRKGFLAAIFSTLIGLGLFSTIVFAGPSDPQWVDMWTITYRGERYHPDDRSRERLWNDAIHTRTNSYVNADYTKCFRLDPANFADLGLPGDPTKGGDIAARFETNFDRSAPSTATYNTQTTYFAATSKYDLIDQAGNCNTIGGVPVTFDSGSVANAHVWFQEDSNRDLQPIWTKGGTNEDDMLGVYSWDEASGTYILSGNSCSSDDPYIKEIGSGWEWHFVWDNAACEKATAQVSNKLVFKNDEVIEEPPPVQEDELFNNMPGQATWRNAKIIVYDWDGDGAAEEFIKSEWSGEDYYELDGNTRCGIFLGTSFDISPNSGLEGRLASLTSTNTAAIASCAPQGSYWLGYANSVLAYGPGVPIEEALGSTPDVRFGTVGDGEFSDDSGIKRISVLRQSNLRKLFYANAENEDDVTSIITIWENDQSSRASGVYPGNVNDGFEKPLGSGCGDDTTRVVAAGGTNFTWSAPVFEGSCNLSNVTVLLDLDPTSFQEEEEDQDTDDDDLIGFQDDDPNVSCEGASRISLGWIVCPILEGLDEATGVMYGVVQKEMRVFGNGLEGLDDANATAPIINYDEIQPIWEGFRNIARSLLVIALFVIIYAEVASSEFFSAYSIRKMLPKFVIAVVGIELSWIVFVEFAEIVEAVSQGIPDLMLAPFDGEKGLTLQINNTIANIAGGSVGLFVLYAIANPAFLLAILPTALAIVLALFAGFVVLVLRRMVLVTLLILAPLALLLWIIPGTEGMFKKWFQAYQNLLFMYPLVQLLIVAGVIMSQIGGTITVDESVLDGGMPLDESIRYLVAILAFFAPYFLIPYTFKFAGQAFSSIAGMVNDRTRGPIDRTRNWAKERRGEAKLDATNRLRGQDPNARGMERLRNIRNRVAAGRALPPVGQRGRVKRLRQDLEAAKHEMNTDEELLGHQVDRADVERQLLPSKLQEERVTLQTRLLLDRVGSMEWQDGNDALESILVSGGATEGELEAAVKILAERKQEGALIRFNKGVDGSGAPTGVSAARRAQVLREHAGVIAEKGPSALKVDPSATPAQRIAVSNSIIAGASPRDFAGYGGDQHIELATDAATSVDSMNAYLNQFVRTLRTKPDNLSADIVGKISDTINDQLLSNPALANDDSIKQAMAMVAAERAKFMKPKQRAARPSRPGGGP